VSVTATPPHAEQQFPVVEIDGGVIEEARRRQRRRRSAGAALGVVILVAGALALWAGGGGRSSAGGGRGPREVPRKLTFVHGRAFIGGQPALIGIEPSLQAGSVGLCIRIADGGGICGGSPPTTGDPLYGNEGGYSVEQKVGPTGEIDTLFTTDRVAAVRVAHLGTFPTRYAPGLPTGAKEVLFYRPPGSRGSVLAPGISPRVIRSGFKNVHYGPALTETLLDAAGRPIRVGEQSANTLPNSYWSGTQTPPARGRCALRSSFPGVQTEWGQVADTIQADRDLAVPAWLTCLHIWFSAGGSSYETALLLNASSPGSSPAPLWGAIPVPGHPGVVETPAVERESHYYFPRPTRAVLAREFARDLEMGGRALARERIGQIERLAGKVQTYWEVLAPAALARRVGPAWLLVRYGHSLAQRLAFLQTLDVTKIELPRTRR